MCRMQRALCGFLMMWSGLAAAGPASKGFPWERVPGIKASDFRTEFLAKVEAKLTKAQCYGRCQESVAECLRRGHATAGRIARDVFSLMAKETPEADIDRWIEARKKMAHPEEVDIRWFQLDGLVAYGDPKAPVVLVEYSDFQCPFCSVISPEIERAVRESRGKAKLYFKNFPLKNHPRALAAAKACVAADLLGKGWDYCPKLFQHQADLSDERFLKMAVEVGLEAERFKREIESDAVIDRIADEKMEGLKNRVQATPALFVNGKEFALQPTFELIRDRIEEELDIQNKKD